MSRMNDSYEDAMRYWLKQVKQASAPLPEPKVSKLPKGVSLTPTGDVGAHRGTEARDLGSFSGAQTMTKDKAGWKSMRDDSAMDSFPAYKSGNHSPAGKTVHTKAGESDLPIPKKASPFVGYAENTPPPKGRALPIRGEHNAD